MSKDERLGRWGKLLLCDESGCEGRLSCSQGLFKKALAFERPIVALRGFVRQGFSLKPAVRLNAKKTSYRAAAKICTGWAALQKVCPQRELALNRSLPWEDIFSASLKANLFIQVNDERAKLT